jgi:hypothetical protein
MSDMTVRHEAVAEIPTVDATEPKRNFRFVASVSATEAYR